MASPEQPITDGVLKRSLCLYGLSSGLSNGMYLLGFYLLPQGFMRGSPQVTVGGMVAQEGSFRGQLSLTLLLNVVLVAGLALVLNFNRVRAVPAGYLVPIALGIGGGLVAGTNSFASSDLTRYNAWEGLAMGLSIGGIETLGFVLFVAATANLTMFEYRSWWRWSGKWKPTRVRGFRDLTLTKSETLTLAVAFLLFLLAAHNETAFSFKR